MTTMTAVYIGIETWSYEIEGNYTNVCNDDGEHVCQLPWAVKDEVEVRAAAYGFGAGRRLGEQFGRATQLREIQKALGIPTTEVSA